MNMDCMARMTEKWKCRWAGRMVVDGAVHEVLDGAHYLFGAAVAIAG